ncbi:hypothetical protein BGW80DRAFT_1438007 [Lactifluus volemus]|nr:hypothetical protein BGW80DRAFT_1438007 [Lactifluus volemus]
MAAAVLMYLPNLGQSSLPNDGPYPHCYLPLHFWLDKGLVTRRIKKYPMILRAAWLPRNIRNASGNGGGILLETHLCNDGVIRILYPGVLIESQDGEEASYFCACRAATANYPCPKCLVHKSELHCITKSFEPRTSESMRSVLERASQATSKAAKEKILQDHGLHDINHFLWDFQFSDPYRASSYDTLHSDDLGKWGKHMWPLVFDVLEDRKSLGRLTANMREFPSWPNLKHFNHVSVISFTDGQSFYDILKCILPCIVQLLPQNSPLIHCIRSYQCYRVVIGLRCMTDRRLDRLKELIMDYEKYCMKVSKEFNKSFDFFKQHYVSHIISDIQQKGTTDNTSTRPGEGFQQEAAEAYKQTNKKQAENQMVRIDENQEAIALIRMTIDNYHRAQNMRAQESVDDSVPETPSSKPELYSIGPHWTFSSPTGSPLDSRTLEKDFAPTNRDYVSFDEHLCSFIICAFPQDAPYYEDRISVQPFKCLKVTYQSMEDWTEGHDTLRCNPDFHHHARYDCVIINDDNPRTTVARLLIDMALIHTFKKSNWKPNTMWDNCQIRVESQESSFVLMDYVVRGALLCPAFDSDPNLHYIVDTVDGDMFLRLNSWS